jgi:farnesyl diphosphate synthase
MDHNVPGGKLNRGMSVVDSVAILKGRDLTESEYFRAAVLGWCVEWVRLFALSL